MTTWKTQCLDHGHRNIKINKQTKHTTNLTLGLGAPGPVQYRQKFLIITKKVEAVETVLWLTI